MRVNVRDSKTLISFNNLLNFKKMLKFYELNLLFIQNKNRFICDVKCKPS